MLNFFISLDKHLDARESQKPKSTAYYVAKVKNHIINSKVALLKKLQQTLKVM